MLTRFPPGFSHGERCSPTPSPNMAPTPTPRRGVDTFHVDPVTLRLRVFAREIGRILARRREGAKYRIALAGFRFDCQLLEVVLGRIETIPNGDSLTCTGHGLRHLAVTFSLIDRLVR